MRVKPDGDFALAAKWSLLDRPGIDPQAKIVACRLRKGNPLTEPPSEREPLGISQKRGKGVS
jgi:hypothetical protein